MNQHGITRRFAWIALIAGAMVGCISADCAGVGIVYYPPADTTVALGETIVLRAGTGGACTVGGPITPDALTYWQAFDPTVVSIVVLDSLHAEITGTARGTTSVITSNSPTFVPTYSTTAVTVR
jgi:hypothetical protein